MTYDELVSTIIKQDADIAELRAKVARLENWLELVKQTNQDEIEDLKAIIDRKQRLLDENGVTS